VRKIFAQIFPELAKKTKKTAFNFISQVFIVTLGNNNMVNNNIETTTTWSKCQYAFTMLIIIT